MLYPHCTYTGNSVIGTGSVFEVSGVEYVGYDGNMYSLESSGSGSESQMRDFLNENLIGYGSWTFSGGFVPSVTLSQNSITTMYVDVDGMLSEIGFDQSDCVELPLSSSTGSAPDAFIDEANLHDMSLVDIWVTMFIAIVAVIRLIIFKAGLGRNY